MSLKARRSLRLAVCISGGFMLVEVIGGILANSIAILSDAAHLSGDVASFCLALGALTYSQRPPSPSYTYGGVRAGALGAFVSILTVWFLTGWIVIEAVLRFFKYTECARMAPGVEDATCKGVDSRLMFGIGLGGLTVNITLAFVLWQGNAGAHVQHMHSHGSDGKCPHSGCGGHGHGHSHGHSHSQSRMQDDEERMQIDIHSPTSPTDIGHLLGEGSDTRAKKGGLFVANAGEDINVKGAMVHAIGDCIQSVGVVIASIVIWVGNVHTVGVRNSSRSWFNLADPCISLVFAAVTLWTTKGLFMQLTRVLLEGAEDPSKVEQMMHEMKELPSVRSIHDFHVWHLSIDRTIASVHVVPVSEAVSREAMHEVKRVLNQHVSHITIQMNSPAEPAHRYCPPMVQEQQAESLFI